MSWNSMRSDSIVTAAGAGGNDLSPVRRRSLQLDVDDVTLLTKTLASPSHSRSNSIKQQQQHANVRDSSGDLDPSHHQLKLPVPVWGVDKMRRLSLPSGSQAFALAADEIIAQTRMERDSSTSTDASSPSPYTNGSSTTFSAFLQPPIEQHHLSPMRNRSGSDVGGLKLNSILKKSRTNYDSNNGANAGSKQRRLKPCLRVSFSDLLHNDSDGDTRIASMEKLANMTTEQQLSQQQQQLQPQKTRRHSFPLIEYSPAAYMSDVDNTYSNSDALYNGNGNHLEDAADLEDKENDQQQSSSSSSSEDVSTNKSPSLAKERRSSVTSVTSLPDDGIVCTVVHSFTPKRAHTRRALPPIRTDLKTLKGATTAEGDASAGAGGGLSVTASSSRRKDLQSVSPSRRLPPIPATPRADEETAERSLH